MRTVTKKSPMLPRVLTVAAFVLASLAVYAGMNGGLALGAWSWGGACFALLCAAKVTGRL